MAEAARPPVRDTDWRLIRRLFGYLRPYRGWTALAVVLLLTHSLLGVATPYLMKVAVDCCLNPVPEPAPFLETFVPLPDDPYRGLAMVAGIYLAVVLLSFVLRGAQIRIMNRTGQRVMYDLRQAMFARLQSMNVAFFDRNRVGRLVARLTSDVGTLNELFTSGVAAVAGDLLTLIAVFGAMLLLSPHLTGALLLIAPAAAALVWIFRRQARESYRDLRGAVGRLSAFLQEQVNGMSVVQLSTREPVSRDELDQLNHDMLQPSIRGVRAHAWFFPAAESLSHLGLALVLLLGAWLIERDMMTLGVIIAFIQYGSKIFRPLQDLSEKFNIMQSAMAGAERIFELLDEPADEPLETSAPTPRRSDDAAPSVEFRNVWFAYSGENWVLEDVSFRAEPNETLAVVGHTGAGKTTLINLLLRFYEPQRGEIFVGGREIRDWSRRELRRQFGVVLQDPYLFHGTIEGNIRLGDPEVTRERAIEAARRVNLAKTVEALPNAWDEPVGERGASLSAGERQLVGFARALAHNPRFLILDEATSNVDPETEIAIREAFGELVEGHTSIVIAHRLSTIRRSNRILVMHRGRVCETGTHRELLARDGVYRRLYDLQFGAGADAPATVDTGGGR